MKKIFFLFLLLLLIVGFASNILMNLPTPATIDATTVNPDSKVKIFMEFYEYFTPYKFTLPGLDFYLYAHVNGDKPTWYKLCADGGYTFDKKLFDFRIGTGMMVERTYVNSEEIKEANPGKLDGISGMVVCYHWSPMVDFAMDTKFDFPINFNLHYTRRLFYIPICKPGINIEVFPHDVLSFAAFTKPIFLKKNILSVIPSTDVKIVFNNFGSGKTLIRNYNIDINLGIFSKFENGEFAIEPQITIPSINAPWRFGARVALMFN